MVLDECARLYPADFDYTKHSMERHTGGQSGARRRDAGRPGVVWHCAGGMYPTCASRARSEIARLDFIGNAIGGLSVGNQSR